MRHGSDWYKRSPQDYLGGVQGLSAREHAVYSIVLDLIYLHGGSVNNDPRWIAGWISDMGAAAVRNAINSLADQGKIILENDQITQKRARNEAKTKEYLRETARGNGKKGGKNSSKNKDATNENNNLVEAVAKNETQADKTREDKTIDAADARAPTHARAREAPPDERTDPLSETWRETLCRAAGHDPNSVAPGGRIPGNTNDMEEVRRWVEDLGLTKMEILRTVREVTAKKIGGPVGSFRYFTPAMQDLAAAKAAPKLEPEGDLTHGQRNSQARGYADTDATDRAIAFAARAIRTPLEDSFRG